MQSSAVNPGMGWPALSSSSALSSPPDLVRTLTTNCAPAILPDQIQPASLDLRLGSVAYRVRASFLVGADSVEALGWLIAELGDMTAYCLVLAAECRRDPSCAGLSKVA